MTYSPSFLELRKIIININEIQSISEIERNGNNCTKIRFKHKDKNYYVKETVEEITNLLCNGASFYSVSF